MATEPSKKYKSKHLVAAGVQEATVVKVSPDTSPCIQGDSAMPQCERFVRDFLYAICKRTKVL